MPTHLRKARAQLQSPRRQHRARELRHMVDRLGQVASLVGRALRRLLDDRGGLARVELGAALAFHNVAQLGRHERGL
eukprot:76166-Chlamydomonas_euryale.AAC.1